MNPIGLTSAEQAQEAETVPVVKQPAPEGAVQCRITVLPDGEACGAAATGQIVWNRDDPKTPACDDCAQRMGMMARSAGSDIRFEPLTNHDSGRSP